MVFKVKKIIEDCLKIKRLAINLDHKIKPVIATQKLYYEILEYTSMKGTDDFKVILSKHWREIIIYHHTTHVIFLADSYERIRGYSMEQRKHIDEYLIVGEEQENEQIQK